MIYAVSDIYGKCEAFKELFRKINFKDRDEMYIIGDCVDKGEAPDGGQR